MPDGEIAQFILEAAPSLATLAGQISEKLKGRKPSEQYQLASLALLANISEQLSQTNGNIMKVQTVANDCQEKIGILLTRSSRQ